MSGLPAGGLAPGNGSQLSSRQPPHLCRRAGRLRSARLNKGTKITREPRSMAKPPDSVLERVKVREVAGIFESRPALDAAVDRLLLAGFDRSDIDVMLGTEALRQRLGAPYVAAKELDDVPQRPRQAYIR